MVITFSVIGLKIT